MLRTLTGVLGGSVLTIVLAAGAVGTAVLSDSTDVACTSTNRSSGRVGHYAQDQTANAATIVRVGAALHIPRRGWVVAIATAIQESSLHNLTGGDRDSVGLFQQRPSQGWGTPQQLHTPTYAATAFYRALRRVPGWQHMAVTDAAQAVQHSAFPDAYARWEPDATHLVATITHHPATAPHTSAGCGRSSRWVSPVIAPISSGFRPPGRPDHNGADLAAARGTPIRAAHAGTVTVARCDPATGNCDTNGSITTAGCGWYVEIRSPDRIITRYCHMATQPSVHGGQKVSAGARIGIVGQSGNADGPHLHFEIHVRNDATPAGAVDPVRFFARRHLHLGARNAP